MKFGYEGLGLFYTFLEKIAKQEKPIKTDVLKRQLNVGKKLSKCWNFMEEIELISSNNGDTFNNQLLNFSEKYQIKKEKNKIRVAEWRENQKDIKNVTDYKQVRNEPKVKKIKGKESKEKTPQQISDENIIHYTNQLKSENKYVRQLSELILGENIAKRPLDKILMMKDPISESNMDEILELGKKHKKQIVDLILKIDEKNIFVKDGLKYKSLSLTLRNWIKSEFKQDNNQTNN